MKSLKLILPVVAFVLAIVTAFASNAFLANAKGKRISDAACVTGTLVNPPSGSCLTTNSTSRCSVTIQDQGESIQVPAFTESGTCQSSEALFYN